MTIRMEERMGKVASPWQPAQLEGMSASLRIDLNADLGESFGHYRLDDTPLLGEITSANVACGFHAGDPVEMRAMVRAAVAHGVVIGAHPGYADRQGFGRRDLAATPDEIAADVIYQLGALSAVCAAAGTRVRYVKPHGALYNRSARDATVAHTIAAAIRDVDPSLTLLGLAGSESIRAAERVGIPIAREAFVDRAYQSNGMLVPRDRPGAVLHDVSAIATRAVRLVREGRLHSIDGADLALTADSLCTHGDGSHALEIVRAVRAQLEAAGVRIVSFVVRE